MEYVVTEEELLNWLFSVSNALGLQPSKTQEYIQNRFLKSKKSITEDNIVEVLNNKLNPIVPMRLCPEGSVLPVRKYNYLKTELREIAKEILGIL